MQTIRIDEDLRIAGEHGRWDIQRRNTDGIWFVVESFAKFHHAFKYAMNQKPPKGESSENSEN